MSRHCQVLLGELPALARMRVTHLRLSPQDCDMVAVAAVYAAVRDRELSAEDGIARLGVIYAGAPFANGFLHGAAGMAWVAA
ncbi:hypothetical protein D3C87_1773800 [compost metagenome]